MSTLIAPHGNAPLKPLLLPPEERDEGLKRARALRKLPLSSREVSDLFMLAMGAYSPLDGFMGAVDWRGACVDMRLENGLFWPLPITLSCGEDFAVAVGDEVALTDGEGEILGILAVAEKYGIDRDLECREVYRTADGAHPGVAKVMAQGPVNLAGPVSVFSEGHFPETYRGLYLRPAETRALFSEKGWSTVAAFQTRNPMHRSHEFLAKAAIEVCDGLLIHQVLGALKAGDIPAEIRVRAIDWLVANHFAAGQGDPGRLSDRDALCRPPGGAVACAVPAELRVLASGGGARPCRARRLLRTLRRPPYFRRDRRRQPRHPAAEVRRHVLLLRLRRHGDGQRVLRRRRRRRDRLGEEERYRGGGGGGDRRRGQPSLPPRRRRKAANLRHAAARDVRQPRSDPARIQPRRRDRHPPGLSTTATHDRPRPAARRPVL